MFGRPTNGGGSGRPVCKFFLEGRCKFGDNCKNEHPRSQAPQQQTNRFAPLQNTNNAGFRGRSGAVGGDQTSAPFAITEDQIRDDLTTGKERPIWPLSAYGPGIKAPRQLLEGPVEVSPEEMRLQCYLAQAAGNPQEYAKQEESMLQQVNQQIQTILSDLPGAKNYVIDGQNQHPNRNDMVLNPTTAFPKQTAFSQTPSTFGAAGAGFGTTSSGFGNAGSGFGAPSNFGATKSAFGAPSSMGQGSAFGAPTSLGQKSAFGNPTASGGNASTALGNSTALGGNAGTAFGKPSSFGQASSLGQSTSPFGGGQQQQQPQPFGQAAKPSPFGQPSALGQTSGFGAQSQQPQQGTAFGQTSAFGAAINKPSPFSQAASSQATNSSPFAQAAQNPPQSSNPFASSAAIKLPQPAAFGTASLPSNPFGASNNTGSGFGSSSSPFVQASSTGNTGFSSNGNWNNKTIVKDEKGLSYYDIPDPTKENPANRRRERIWHPDGAPSRALPDAEGPAEVYTGDLGKLLESIYTEVREKGVFGATGSGVMPEIPPKREWIGWDL